MAKAKARKVLNGQEVRQARLVEWFVWCDRHNTVHDDTLDPYGYGNDSELCRQEEHAPLYTVERATVPVLPFKCWCREKFSTQGKLDRHRKLAGHGGDQ